MNLYEYVNPSDKITFYAENDKIAYLATIILGDGKTGCVNLNNKERLPTVLIFSREPAFEMEQFLQEDVSVFYEKNKAQFAATFNSFAYGSKNERKDYDKAFDLICDDEELESFRQGHDRVKRTSFSQIVLGAWSKADKIKNDLKKLINDNTKQQDEKQA